MPTSDRLRRHETALLAVGRVVLVPIDLLRVDLV